MGSKYVWPELIGWEVAAARQWLMQTNPGRCVSAVTFDTAYMSGAPNIIRVVYDPKTGKVVHPPPFLSALQKPGAVGESCFLRFPGCSGAPRPPPPAGWASFMGKDYRIVTDYLRAAYPHATIVAKPSCSPACHDLRLDRITVIYDSGTLRVIRVPVIG